MHIAALNGHPDTAMVLFKKGVPLLMPNRNGARGIHTAAMKGHVAVINSLLSKGENVDAVTNVIWIHFDTIPLVCLHYWKRFVYNCVSCLFTFSTDLHLFVYNCQLFIYITIITGQLHRITFSSRSRQTSSGRNAIGSRSNSSHQRSVPCFNTTHARSPATQSLLWAKF